jgi:hypothetical protein
MVNIRTTNNKIMKMNFYKNIIIGFFIFTFQFSAFSQTDGYNCSRKNECDFDLGDYDYRTQSKFGIAYPGDTIVIKTVVYANKKYNFAICANPDLGDIKWKVVIPKRKTKREFVKVIADTLKTQKIKPANLNVDEDTKEYLMENDEYYEYDYEGEPVYSKIEVEIIDTLWKTTTYTDEIKIFDNTKGTNLGKSFKKTSRVFIYIYIPPGDEEEGYCYNAYIGRISMASRRTFKR